MKKLLLAVVFIYSVAISFGQPKTISKEEARFICAEMMANFTESVTPYFKDGMSYDEFRSALPGDVKPTKEATALLMSSFEMLVNKTERDVILRMYSGVEMAHALQYMYHLHEKGISSNGAELFGINKEQQREMSSNSDECRWYDLWCKVKDFANWVIENWGTIQQIIIFIISTF